LNVRHVIGALSTIAAMRFERHQSAVVLASVLTVASFVGTTAYTQYRLRALDTLSSAIATNAAPSIVYLGHAGGRLLRIRQLLYDNLTAPGPSSANVATISDELQALESDIDRYLALTPLPGEGYLWREIRRDLDQVKAAAEAALGAERRGDIPTATALFRSQVEPTFDRARLTMSTALEFDVRQSEQFAREVEVMRRSTGDQIVILDILSTLVAAAAAFVALRAARDHDRLLERHSALLSERVDELDRFAGRVAHDVLSPLDAVAVGLALVGRTADAHARTHIERAQRAVQRVHQLVDGLLGYARSGAANDAEARCPVDVVLSNVAADYAEPDRSMGAEIVLEPCEPLEAACSVGVLTSIVQNLVANAIKHMGERPVRRVTLRARRTDARARIEIEDTGPGIAADQQKRIFEPFVRLADDGVAGMGLGLATVRRLVQGHGGAVGVDSRLGSGTVFWFELPLRDAPLPPGLAPTHAPAAPPGGAC
jgi:signal transduction histidine kinase